MKKFEILGLSIMLFAGFAAIAAAEDLTLGTAQISLDTSGLGDCSVDTGDPIDDYHDSPRCDFGYTLYPSTISSEDGRITLELFQLDQTCDVTQDLLEHCVSESDLAPYGTEVEPFTVNGHAGIMAKGYADEAQTKTLYVAAFSPEGDSGPAKTFMIVGSDLSWDLTSSILDSLEVAVQ